MSRVLIANVMCAILLASTVTADIPMVTNYQGRVIDDLGNPVADGTYSMRFRIFNADEGGDLRWDSGVQSIQVNGGVFNVLLGDNPMPSLDLPFDEDYWLVVTFEGINQTPRQRLSSCGYAYMASGIVPGTEIVGDIGGPILNVVNFEVIGVGLRGETAGLEGAAVVGHATATDGMAAGIRGESNAAHGTGVLGWANADSDSTTGVSGRSDGVNGRGVSGWATTTTGGNIGVYGASDSNAGVGVYGLARATTGITAGIQGVTDSPVGYGVYGEASATTLTAKGVYAKTRAPFGAGVYSEALATTGNCAGVYAGCASNGGIGIWGEATATAGVTYGVYGNSRSTNGYGIYGEASSSTGSTYGLYGKCLSSSGIAIYGENTSTLSGGSGVVGVSNSTSGTGVSGITTTATGYTCGGSFRSMSVDGTGVHGIADTHGVGQSYGGWFQSSANAGRGVHAVAAHPTGFTYGVYGMALSSYGYGVYYSGGLAGTGTKSCVVKTSQGPTLMYCQESPENWFEDFGEGQLVNGRCHIELDPLFLETVTIDEAHPMKVFIQLIDECNGMRVERGTTGFDVIELREGSSDAAFMYRIVAKREGFETRRLDICEAGRMDAYLYPELAEKELRELKDERMRNESISP